MEAAKDLVTMGSLGASTFDVDEYAKDDAIVYVNGKRHVLPPDSAHRTLLEYLRGLFAPYSLSSHLLAKHMYACPQYSVHVLELPEWSSSSFYADLFSFCPFTPDSEICPTSSSTMRRILELGFSCAQVLIG